MAATGRRASGPFAVGNNVSIAIEGQSREHCDAVFAKLSAGLRHMLLQETFWGAYYALWTDRFGIHWMLNHPPPKEQAAQWQPEAWHIEESRVATQGSRDSAQART